MDKELVLPDLRVTIKVEVLAESIAHSMVRVPSFGFNFDALRALRIGTYKYPCIGEGGCYFSQKA
ncbi:hypothetical protein DSUL_160092 [Desulfovibrionales bacterium]